MCSLHFFSRSPELKNEFNVVFNRKVSDGWLHFRNSFVKWVSFNRAVNKQWSKPKWGQFTCPGDCNVSECKWDFWKTGILHTSQPCLNVEMKGHYSVIWHWLFSDAYYSSATPEHHLLHPHVCPDGSSAALQVSSAFSLPVNFLSSALICLQFTPNLLWCCLNLFQTNTLSSATLSTCRNFVLLEFGIPMQTSIATKAQSSSHKGPHSSLQQLWNISSWKGPMRIINSNSQCFLIFLLIQMPSKSTGEIGKDTIFFLAQGNCSCRRLVVSHDANNILGVDSLPYPRADHSPQLQKEWF